MSQPLKVGVLGASGYAGGELVRLLLQHPQAELTLAAAPSGEGQPLAAVHPSLHGLTQLPLAPLPAAGDQWPELDCVFLCLPHGASRDLVPLLPPGPKVIDLGGDFRLADPEVFAQYYGMAPPPAEWQRRFVYGQPESTSRAQIAAAHYVANPGCFATAVILALAPLLRALLVEERIIIDAKTGSTGAGAKPTPATQHATRSNSFFAYKSFQHQHLPEIQQELARATAGSGAGIVLQVHSTPLVRGIFASIYCQLHRGIGGNEVAVAYHDAYAESPFIRLRDGSPNVNWSRGSNFVDIGWSTQGRELTVFAALDNLGKGAAGQAVQNMNLMFGLAETSGLWQAGGIP